MTFCDSEIYPNQNIPETTERNGDFYLQSRHRWERKFSKIPRSVTVSCFFPAVQQLVITIRNLSGKSTSPPLGS